MSRRGSDSAAVSMVGGKKKPLGQRIWEHKVLYLFILPAVIWLLIFCYWPMYGITLAFKDYHYNLGILGSPWVGFEVFEDFITSPDFWNMFKNTLVISVLKLVFTFPAPIILSLLLNEVMCTRFKRVIQTMSYLPNFVSWVVVVSLLNIIFTPYGGVINDIRAALGYNEAIFFMGEPEYFYQIAVGSELWKNVGWNTIVYLSTISGVSQELYEAAIIDGAGRLKCTWHVTLPAIKFTIGIMLIMAIGGILNANFEQILLLQQPANLSISQILDTYVLEVGLRYGNFELSTAVGLFKSVFALALMALANFASSRLMEVSLW